MDSTSFSPVLWLRQTLEIARQATRRGLRDRLVRVLVVLGLLGAVAALFIPDRLAQEVSGSDLYGILTYWIVIQFALPFTVLFFGVNATHGDLEDRTSTYLFIRPIHRSSLLIGKWLAATLLGAGLFVVLLSISYAGVALPDRAWRQGIAPSTDELIVFLTAAVLAAPAYAAVACAVGATFKRPLVWGAVFIVGWEVIVSNLPPEAGVRGATVAEPLRRWIWIQLDPPRASDLYEALSGALYGRDPLAFGEPLGALARFTGIAVLIALLVYSSRQYDARPRD